MKMSMLKHLSKVGYPSLFGIFKCEHKSIAYEIQSDSIWNQIDKKMQLTYETVSQNYKGMASEMGLIINPLKISNQPTNKHQTEKKSFLIWIMRFMIMRSTQVPIYPRSSGRNVQQTHLCGLSTSFALITEPLLQPSFLYLTCTAFDYMHIHQQCPKIFTKKHDNTKF